MHANALHQKLKPHLWFQLYWLVYLVWFFWLDRTVKDPKYIIHVPLDDRIPFNEWFVFPYCSWFFLLAGVTALLWWYDTASYDKLCLMMFSGMTFCLILYMVLPNGLDIRPTAEAVGRDNIARARAVWRWLFPKAGWQSTARPCRCWPGRGRCSSVRPRSSPSSTRWWTWSAGWHWWPCGCLSFIKEKGGKAAFVAKSS